VKYISLRQKTKPTLIIVLYFRLISAYLNILTNYKQTKREYHYLRGVFSTQKHFRFNFLFFYAKRLVCFSVLHYLFNIIKFRLLPVANLISFFFSPKKSTKITVLKSPHINKTAREQFEIKKFKISLAFKSCNNQITSLKQFYRLPLKVSLKFSQMYK
jgi:hypothetical protein